MAALTREEIEQRRAAAIAAGKTGGGMNRAPNGESTPARGTPAMPNQSRLTLARAGIRPEMKGRVMMSGPPGAGKTYTGLVIATTLVGPHGRILVIDSEKESSLTYADVFDFDQLPWNPPFDPTALSLTLKEAAETYDCIIVDSFSHFWRKQGGVLDIAGDNVRGWKSARPIQENLIETLLDIDAHVIVCCRSKMDHLIEQKDGKTVVTKAGIKAQQDDDLEYEVNVAVELDMPHVLHVVKSRTNAVPVGSQYLAGLAGDFAQEYRDWLKSGEPVAAKQATDALAEGLNQIEDEGERRKAKAQFLNTFGRPEFLLVSRLEEAKQWVVAVATGALPIERAEDDVPPEDSPPEGSPAASGTSSGESAHPAPATTQSDESVQTGDASGGDSPDAHEGGDGVVVGEMGGDGNTDPDPAEVPRGTNGAESVATDTAQPPEPESTPDIEPLPETDTPDIAEPEALPETGTCAVDGCDVPLWRDEDGWHHVDDDVTHLPVYDATGVGPSTWCARCEVYVPVAEVAEHVKGHPAETSVDERKAIEARVAKMSSVKVIAALEKTGLSVAGPAKTLRARLVDHLCASPVA